MQGSESKPFSNVARSKLLQRQDHGFPVDHDYGEESGDHSCSVKKLRASKGLGSQRVAHRTQSSCLSSLYNIDCYGDLPSLVIWQAPRVEHDAHWPMVGPLLVHEGVETSALPEINGYENTSGVSLGFIHQLWSHGHGFDGERALSGQTKRTHSADLAVRTVPGNPESSRQPSALLRTWLWRSQSRGNLQLQDVQMGPGLSSVPPGTYTLFVICSEDSRLLPVADASPLFVHLLL